ncbi:unnamed protein product [Caenorhabditis brenneri]
MTIEYQNPKCLVCGNNGNGQHYGVQTCRACAMFYRRSLAQRTEYQCKKLSKFCDIHVAEHRLMCKSCRLKKCQEAGMSSEKKFPQSEKSEKFGSDPQVARNRYGDRVIYDVIDPDTGVISRLIDVAPIIKKSRLIIEDDRPLPDTVSHLNPLEKSTFALQKLRSGQNPAPEIIYSLPFRDYFYLWEQNMRWCAEWLMYMDEFRELPKHERLEIFKLVWALWRRVERKTMSAKIFGKRCLDEKILLLSNDVAGIVGNFQMDVSEILSDHKGITSMFGDEINQYYQDLVKPFLKLNLTDTEVTFILCQLVWNYASRRLQGQTATAGEKFLEKISNNLNDYYRSIDREIIGNYAGRLANIMKIVNNVLTLQLKQEKLMDMVFLFDMFNFKFSDPAFFSV